MAGRRKKTRLVGIIPDYLSFVPEGQNAEGDEVTLALDELETIRLIDLEGLDQQDAAARMGIARTTVTALYASARHTIAEALVNGHPLAIEDEDASCMHETAYGTSWNPKQKEHLMRIAVTYDDGAVFQHFGRTQQFKLYDIEDGSVASSEVVGTDGIGHGALAGLLAQNGVDVLICGGLGGGALNALRKADIAVFSGAAGACDEAVAAYLAGQMTETVSASCSSHEHGHEHGHSCGCSCGKH